MRKVQIIPQCQRPAVLLRTCGYARVSTDGEDQLESVVTQIEYYTTLIKKNPEWIYAGVYADEGITGTSAYRRDEFNRMIGDCRKGKVDLIITKSISRFARNTYECIQVIRELKQLGIGIYFEKENINTLGDGGEMLITILSSRAQEESRNLSKNVHWGYVRQFENGVVYVNHNKFLGYTKDEEGNLVIVLDEAKLVRRIFRLYLEGNSINKIAETLTKEGIRTVTGNTVWHATVISKMLMNEKYMGDALLQKNYTVDFLEKNRAVNRGIVPQYYIEGNHEAIIPRELFYQVQEERARRANVYRPAKKKGTTIRGKYSSKYVLADIMYCKECGQPYRRQV